MTYIGEGSFDKGKPMQDTAEEPTVAELDEMLEHLRELLKDPRLTPRRKILVLNAIDDMLDDRLDKASYPSL